MTLSKTYKSIALIGISLIFMKCDKIFEFSPYESGVNKALKNTTNKNLQLIKDIRLNSDTFSFAFVTDNHFHYDNLRTVIDDINKIQNDKYLDLNSINTLIPTS